MASAPPDEVLQCPALGKVKRANRCEPGLAPLIDRMSKEDDIEGSDDFRTWVARLEEQVLPLKE